MKKLLFLTSLALVATQVKTMEVKIPTNMRETGPEKVGGKLVEYYEYADWSALKGEEGLRRIVRQRQASIKKDGVTYVLMTFPMIKEVRTEKTLQGRVPSKKEENYEEQLLEAAEKHFPKGIFDIDPAITEKEEKNNEEKEKENGRER